MSEATSAQDDPVVDDTAAKDPVLEALEREKEISTLKKEIAENQQKTLAATLPSSTTTGKTGKADFKVKSGYYAEILAYEALADAAGEIAQRTQKPAGGTPRLIVTTKIDVAKEGQRWHLIKTRLDDFASRFDKLLHDYPEDFDVRSSVKPEAVATALAALPAVLGAAADVAAFFRTDLTVTAVEVTLAESALLAEVAQQVQAQGWAVFLPSLSFDRGVLVTQLDGLLTRRGEVAGRKDALGAQIKTDLVKLAGLRTQVVEAKAALQAAKKKKPADAAAVAAAEQRVQELGGRVFPLARIESEWNNIAGRFDAHLTGFDALVSALTVGAAGKPAPIEAVQTFDLIKSQSGADLLYVEVSSQGGEIHVVEKSFAAARISYLAGAVCSFFQTGPAGELRVSGTIAVPKARAFKVKNLVEGTGAGGR